MVAKMSDKCKKYETLFTFGTNEEFAKHLEICEDCQEEHKKMQKTESLIKEVKPYYQNAPKSKIQGNLIKIAAGLVVV